MGHRGKGEFLVANPEFTSANVLLTKGQEVNTALIDPVVNIAYVEEKIEDVKKIEVKTNVVNLVDATEGTTGLADSLDVKTSIEAAKKAVEDQIEWIEID